MTTSPDFQNAQFMTLQNGLRVMFCQQENSPTSYVSMAVKAGHFYDPNNCQGLAHLLEHMLFMGSRHLPAPNEINDLVSKHGGSINAWTGTEYANYHFHCHTSSLPGIIPAFADILRRPLIDKQVITNEVRSIDAEFRFKRKDDLRRLYQIHKETCNPAHPFSQFSVGNAEIFNQLHIDELHSMLQLFHRQYYCAGNMTLCIISPLTPDDAVKLIQPAFGQFDSGKEAHQNWPRLYEAEQLGVEIRIRPLQAARRMIVTFALPGLHNDYKTKPLNYISHLLGDEGEGSLLAYLKSKNWATNLIAGSGIEGEHFKDFNVSFQLTQSGIERYEDVLKALFDTLVLVRRSFEEPWRYQEKARLAALALQYEENVRPLNLACEYAQHLFSFAPKDIVQFRSTIDSFDKPLLEEALSYFRPDNMRIKIISQDVETDRTCQFYDARYKVEKLSPALIKSLADRVSLPTDIYLPDANPYLGDENHLVLPEQGQDTPHIIASAEGYNFWFAQDHHFHSPKGDIYLSFDMASFSQDLQAVAAKRIWLGALDEFLQAKYYRAEIAGLNYRIYGHQAGLTLHTRGFTNQQMLLAEQLLEAIMAFSMTPAAFERSKRAQIQALQNSLLNKPTNRLFSRLSVLVQRNTQAPIELLKAVESCQFESVNTIRDASFSTYFVEGFMHGNWSANDARSFSEIVSARCPNTNGTPISRAVSQLPVGKSHYHQVQCEHEDAAVVLYLQAPSASLNDIAMCMVLEQMLAAPFFNALRTEQQLGYVVGTGYVPHNQHPGISFYVQSPTHGPEALLNAMTGFLFQQLHEIEFYQYYWSSIQQNLLKQLEERDLSLSMKSQRLWVSLGTKDLEFNRNTRLAECIANISFDDIRLYATKLAERALFGEMVLFACGKFDRMETPADATISNIAAFKSNTPYFN